MKKLYKIQNHLQEEINVVIVALLANSDFFHMRDQIQGYIADVASGTSWDNPYRFTVPYWAYNPSFKKNRESNGGYFIYYVAHELSHILGHIKYGVVCNHDKKFYEMFTQICPEEYQHYELEYIKTSSRHGVKKL